MMGTERELRERVAEAVQSERRAAAMFDALNIPLSVLSWVSAHPESAKGLAAGEMVAVDRYMLVDVGEYEAELERIVRPSAPRDDVQGET